MVYHTLVANFKLVKVSAKWACSGLIITNISVLEFPPSEFCNKYVSYRTPSQSSITLSELNCLARWNANFDAKLTLLFRYGT